MAAVGGSHEGCGAGVQAGSAALHLPGPRWVQRPSRRCVAACPPCFPAPLAAAASRQHSAHAALAVANSMPPSMHPPTLCCPQAGGGPSAFGGWSRFQRCSCLGSSKWSSSTSCRRGCCARCRTGWRWALGRLGGRQVRRRGEQLCSLLHRACPAKCDPHPVALSPTQARNRLDIYLPRKEWRRQGARPTVIFITGGAWTIGYKGGWWVQARAAVDRERARAGGRGHLAQSLRSWPPAQLQTCLPAAVRQRPHMHARRPPPARAAWGALLARRLSQRGVLVFCLDYRNFPQVPLTPFVPVCWKH